VALDEGGRNALVKWEMSKRPNQKHCKVIMVGKISLWRDNNTRFERILFLFCWTKGLGKSKIFSEILDQVRAT
jgi:hypothetical protein